MCIIDNQFSLQMIPQFFMSSPVTAHFLGQFPHNDCIIWVCRQYCNGYSNTCLYSELICAQLHLTFYCLHGLQPARLLSPWNFPGKDCHFFFKRIFLTLGSNQSLLCLLHWQAGFFATEPLGKPFSELMNMILLGLGVNEIDDLWKYVSLAFVNTVNSFLNYLQLSFEVND